MDMSNASQMYYVLTIILYAMFGVVCYQLTYSLSDDPEHRNTSWYYNNRIKNRFFGHC